VPPARGSLSARGIVTRRAETSFPASGSAGLGSRQPDRRSRTRHNPISCRLWSAIWHRIRPFATGRNGTRRTPENLPSDFQTVGQLGDAGGAQIETAADREIVWQLHDAGAAQIEVAVDLKIIGQLGGGGAQIKAAADREIVGQLDDAGVAQIEVAADRQIVGQLGDAGAAQIEVAADRQIVGQPGDAGAAQIDFSSVSNSMMKSALAIVQSLFSKFVCAETLGDASIKLGKHENKNKIRTTDAITLGA
jgi:hypothetical protein